MADDQVSDPKKGSEQVVNVGRRAVLEQLAVGGAAIAAIGLSRVATASPTAGAPEASQCAALQTVQSGKIRRVITGCNADGKSKVVSDAIVDVTASMWLTTTDQPLGVAPAGEPSYSRLHQSRYGIETFMPNQDPKPSRENGLGWHTTPGVSHIFVLHGSMTYITDLDEVKLNAGDMMIQRNTAHTWRNDGTEPVKLLVALFQ